MSISLSQPYTNRLWWSQHQDVCHLLLPDVDRVPQTSTLLFTIHLRKTVSPTLSLEHSWIHTQCCNTRVYPRHSFTSHTFTFPSDLIVLNTEWLFVSSGQAGESYISSLDYISIWEKWKLIQVANPSSDIRLESPCIHPSELRSDWFHQLRLYVFIRFPLTLSHFVLFFSFRISARNLGFILLNRSTGELNVMG